MTITAQSDRWYLKSFFIEKRECFLVVKLPKLAAPDHTPIRRRGGMKQYAERLA
jgi:hypothetical protein